MAKWRNGGMVEWRNGGMADHHGQWPKLFKSNRVTREWKKRRAARSSCAVLGTCFVNRKKVRSFTFPGTLYMRTQERCHRRCIYGQFKYLTNDRHTTINLRRHPMNADGVCNARTQSSNSYRRTWILSVV
jgi:hypothetical protein